LVWEARIFGKDLSAPHAVRWLAKRASVRISGTTHPGCKSATQREAATSSLVTLQYRLSHVSRNLLSWLKIVPSYRPFQNPLAVYKQVPRRERRCVFNNVFNCCLREGIEFSLILRAMRAIEIYLRSKKLNRPLIIKNRDFYVWPCKSLQEMLRHNSLN
jgi:hypothetical protein